MRRLFIIAFSLLGVWLTTSGRLEAAVFCFEEYCGEPLAKEGATAFAATVK